MAVQYRETTAANGVRCHMGDVKVVFLGDTKVGKSSILHRYCQNEFSGQLQVTIGTAVQVKEVEIDDKIFKFRIWDTAGQERYRSMLPMFLRSTAAVVVTYDITTKSTFENLQFWMNEVKNHMEDDVVCAIVGNKCDLPDAREVSTQDGVTFAESYNAIFTETSAKTGTNIKDIFYRIGKRLALTYRQTKVDEDTIKLSQSSPQKGCFGKAC